ncbi:hypothetical protein RUND412_010242, partial [Rhizina undulata]
QEGFGEETATIQIGDIEKLFGPYGPINAVYFHRNVKTFKVSVFNEFVNDEETYVNKKFNNIKSRKLKPQESQHRKFNAHRPAPTLNIEKLNNNQG